nr:DUF3418 domain-containing protein [Actinomyces qiguomingii]
MRQASLCCSPHKSRGQHSSVLIQIVGPFPDFGWQAVLTEAHWLIEELRVSLFAQTLRTARKVSVQRISKLLAKV